MKNSSFEKVYLSLIEEEKRQMRLAQTFSQIILEEDEKKAVDVANAAAKQAEDKMPPKEEKGWWSKAWDCVVDVAKATPVLGDVIAICSGDPSKGPIIQAGMKMVDAGKAAFTPQEVKDFREACKKDKNLQDAVAKFKINIDDDDEVIKFAQFLREQAAIAKKAQDDEEFKKQLLEKVKAKQGADKAGRENKQALKKAAPNFVRQVEKSKLAAGTYKIVLGD